MKLTSITDYSSFMHTVDTVGTSSGGRSWCRCEWRAITTSKQGPM